MKRVLLTLFFAFLTGIYDYQLYCSGAPGHVEPHAFRLRFKREDSSSSQAESNEDGSAVAGVIISNSKNDSQVEHIISAEAIGNGAGTISAAVGENGTISGVVASANDDDLTSSWAAVSGLGVVSVAKGNGTSFTIKNKTMNFATSSSSGDSDEAIGISSKGDAVAAVISKNGEATKTNRVSTKKNKNASASASGSVTATSITDGNSSAVATFSSGEGHSTGTTDSSGAGSSTALVSSNNKNKKGIGTSGSTSGGSAVTSISASDEDDSDESEHSGSISAISTRLLKNEKSYRKRRRGPIYGSRTYEAENMRRYPGYRYYMQYQEN